jgi:hypothetical protein
VEPTRSRRAQQRDQRIGDHLDDRDACAEHEQRQQEHTECGRARRRDEQQAPHRHGQQADRRGPHVACAPHDRGRRQGEQQISDEEGGIDEVRLRMAEGEQLLQLGHNDVVERRDAAEDEEQGEHEDAQIGRVVAVFGIAARRRRAAAGAVGIQRDHYPHLDCKRLP